MNSHSLLNIRRPFAPTLTLLLAAPLAWSQTPPPAAPVAAEPPSAVPAAPREAEPPEPLPADPVAPAAEPGFRWQADFRRAGQQAQRAYRDVQRQMSGLRFGVRGPDARRLLVIPGAEATDDEMAQSRDDLAVMSTILARAAHPENPRRGDVLLEIDGWRAGSGRELDALMLDGYGAIFFLGVEYPLVKPPTSPESTSEPKTKNDTTWERTRREVLGQGDGEDEGSDAEPEDDDSPGRAFDADRVTALEQRLFEALRHAGNLRGIAPNNWIVIQVTGRAPQGTWPGETGFVYGGAGGGYGGTAPNSVDVFRRRAPRGTSTLTLRVVKSAVDDFAANRTKLEEFSRAVQVSRRWEKPTARP